MNISPSGTCGIRIEPRKTEGLAFITLTLEHARWQDLGQLVPRITESTIRQQPLLLDHTLHNRDLRLTVPYTDQEKILTILASLLQQAGIRIGKKQIHIEKLGGWFEV